MTIESHPHVLEPEDQNVIIWRFMELEKFRDMMATGELYFCRADLFQDESEGLPPDGYYPTRSLNPLDLHDRRELDNSIGSVAQFREGFYVSCWHLFREETCEMWGKYGQDGVAICSTYRLLKSELDVMGDRTFLGQVRYGSEGIEGWNLFRFIFTKKLKYRNEQEVRALLWICDPFAGINRHFDCENRVYSRPLTPPPSYVPAGQRRKVNLQTLITEIVVTPWMSSATRDQIETLVNENGYEIAVRPSSLTRYRDLLPCS